MPADREVAGMRCMEVLAALPDYLDGTVDDARRAQIDAHLGGCDWCATFGGRYAAVVSALQGDVAEPTPDEVAGRLDALLR